MKSLVILFVYTVFFLNITEVQEEFHRLNNEDEELIFIEKYHGDLNPSVQAYICAVEMKQAEYRFNPMSKLRIFKKTKNKLEELILKNPKNIDLRYVRLLLQEKTPELLGYKDNIQEDKLFLQKELSLNNISKDLELYIHKNTSI